MTFNIFKFNTNMSCNIWKVQMTAVLTHNESRKVIARKKQKSFTMTDEQWEELYEKALSMIQLCLEALVLHEVLNRLTMAYL